MKTLFTAEVVSEGGRSGTLQTPNLSRNVTLGDLLGKGRMSQAADRIKIGLGLALLAALTGCVGYVDGGYVGGGYVGAVVVPEPGVYFWGGDHDRGRDVHVYSHRGYESRAVAHPSGGGHGGKR
ncbi:hypothetical protein SBV1_730050 [Verrucomicrobia bacterium]|nr:hypothetical protein SBV1_730050 [Verrucomicrobiota bacterium]